MNNPKGFNKIIKQYFLIIIFAISGISTASASLILASGDSTPAFYAADPGNDAFFANILEGGNSVLGHELYNSSMGGNMNNYYNSLAGVSSSYLSSADINDALLADVDLFVTGLFNGALTDAEIASLNSFIAGGGSVMFMGEYTYSFDGINAALMGIGSGMALNGPNIDIGDHYAGIAVDPLTSGVGQYRYGATYGVDGGTALFFDSQQRSILSYEAVNVPEASTLFLLGVGLLGIGFARRRRNN